MKPVFVALLCVFACGSSFGDDTASAQLSVKYEVARAHEIKPHRRSIPVSGVEAGFNQFQLTLTVSPNGDVIQAEHKSDGDLQKYWPVIQGEVLRWRFLPFEKDGHAITASVEEYVDLVPPERLPVKHVVAPGIRPNSKVSIELARSGCFGSCPSYAVTISDSGIVFNGQYFVTAVGQHTAAVHADEVRAFAKKFVDADFYSMAPMYRANVTDCPTFTLAITIDGVKQSVVDYVGEWEGMPSVISELEDATDEFAKSDRWVNGANGLVAALRDEHFNFRSYEAQTIVKEAATRDQLATVQQMLEAGVPLKPIPPPPSTEKHRGSAPGGWLQVAARHPDVLEALIAAGASEHDQADKDLGLTTAASTGSVKSIRALIAYGANPNANLSKLTVTDRSGAGTVSQEGADSILIHAAGAGNPEALRELLQYHPDLNSRDFRGRTALFAASEYGSEADGDRVTCVRLLVDTGADVNARDRDGNTALHETFLTDVEQELLRLGANVNAKNNDGETPIFTTVDDDAMLLYMEHGADLTIRNHKGETVFEAAHTHGPMRVKALQDASETLAMEAESKTR